MTIDMFAPETQFVDHLAAVWNALPDSERGKFIVTRGMEEHARKRGVVPIRDTAHDPETPVLVANYGGIKTMRKAGRRRLAYIEHGIGQSYAGDPTSATNPSYSGGRDREDNGLFLVPSASVAERWLATYPTANVQIVGCPKLDEAPAYEPGPPVVALSFHFDCRLVQETRSTLAYYLPVLADVASRFSVIGHGHPKAFWYDSLHRRYTRLGIPVVQDFHDVLRTAAVYVCDNSSSMFEFAATGRPVVVLNQPADGNSGYRRDVNHGLRFWEAANVGINVWKPDDLAPAIELALADPSEVREAREKALDIVYAYRTGAARRAADALMAWASERQEVAA